MRTWFKNVLARGLSDLENEIYWRVNSRLHRWSAWLSGEGRSGEERSGEAEPSPGWPELDALLHQLRTPTYVPVQPVRASELLALLVTRWPALAEVEVGVEEALFGAVCQLGREVQDAWWQHEDPEPREVVRLLICLEMLEQCHAVARPLARALQSPEQLAALREFLKHLKDGREREDGEP